MSSVIESMEQPKETRKEFSLTNLSLIHPVQLQNISRTTGTHIIIGDLHLDPRQYLPNFARTESSTCSQHFLVKSVLKKLTQDKDLVALTINGDVFDWGFLWKLSEGQRVITLARFYSWILDIFDENKLDCLLFVNAGNHEFEWLGKNYENGDFVLNLKIKTLLADAIEQVSKARDRRIRVIGFNPRQTFLFQPVLDSPPIALSHFAYDISPGIYATLTKQQKRYPTTLGNQPLSLYNKQQKILSTKEQWEDSPSINRIALRISSDVHFSYKDNTYSIYNTGTLSAPSKAKDSAYTMIQIRGQEVLHLGIADYQGQFIYDLKKVDSLTKDLQILPYPF